MLERKAHHKQLKRKPWNRKPPPRASKNDFTLDGVIVHIEKKPKPRKRLNPIGKNILVINKRAWNKEWKADYAHIIWCESCGRPDGPGDAKLTQMHAQKQRFITTREGCRRSAKVCWGEHRPYDEATGDDPHKAMADFVDNLIKKRGGDIYGKGEK